MFLGSITSVAVWRSRCFQVAIPIIILVPPLLSSPCYGQSAISSSSNNESNLQRTLRRQAQIDSEEAQLSQQQLNQAEEQARIQQQQEQEQLANNEQQLQIQQLSQQQQEDAEQDQMNSDFPNP